VRTPVAPCPARWRGPVTGRVGERHAGRMAGLPFDVGDLPVVEHPSRTVACSASTSVGLAGLEASRAVANLGRVPANNGHHADRRTEEGGETNDRNHRYAADQRPAVLA